MVYFHSANPRIFSPNNNLGAFDSITEIKILFVIFSASPNAKAVAIDLSVASGMPTFVIALFIAYNSIAQNYKYVNAHKLNLREKADRTSKILLLVHSPTNPAISLAHGVGRKASS